MNKTFHREMAKLRDRFLLDFNMRKKRKDAGEKLDKELESLDMASWRDHIVEWIAIVW